MKLRKKVVLGGIFLGLFAGIGIPLYVHSKADEHIYANIDSLSNRYVAIIFGAGLRTDGTPSKYLKDRLDAGILLYKSGKVSRILLSGDNGTNYYDEVTAMKIYCSVAGVPVKDIFLDYAGFDTYSTVYRAKDLFKVENAILVSQAYHLSRAVFLAQELGLDVVGFAADKGDYRMAKKNKIREQAAIVKAFFDVKRNRKPRFTGGDINIKGESNFDKK